MSKTETPQEVTRLIEAARLSERGAADQLLTLLYEELHDIARRRMRAERSDHTLQATALVHEAYMRLIGNTEVRWQNRAHFLAVAAEAMRRILVDAARRKQRIKHGGSRHRVDFVESVAGSNDSDQQLLALNESLTRLAARDPQKAELVKLRHFAGMSLEQSAEVLGISRATACRYWEYARAWLLRDMLGEQSPRAVEKSHTS